MKKILLICFFGISSHVFSQFTIKGTVKNDNNEPLTGANVIIENTYRGAVVGPDGNYEIKYLRGGQYTIIVSYLGYNEQEKEINLDHNLDLNFLLTESSILTEDVVVKGVRASAETPTTFAVIDKEEIKNNNSGKDLPFILNLLPSVVVTSDAGNGVGYTGLRIRGSDSKKINVTINGVPLNDSESHGVYWVDIPDIAGSTQNMQIQRGVGSSTNGAGAFGASINMVTDNFSKNAFSKIDASYGSFNTYKTSLAVGTGLLNDHWFFEAKGSKINSDGYIDRAWSDLKSYFVQGGYYSKNTLIKTIVFGGWEETYQAWYGIDEFMMNDLGRTFNSAGAYYIDRNTGKRVGFWDGYYRENKDDLEMKFYDNFIDHYQQNHFQLHLAQQLKPELKLNIALHYTIGKGYYEEFWQNENFADYGLPPVYYGKDSVETVPGTFDYYYHDTINTSDFVRRLWLDNDFYGTTWSLDYNLDLLSFIVGGGMNIYDNARHFGKIIWASQPGITMYKDKFYENSGEKKDFNIYGKIILRLIPSLKIYGDLQLRSINCQAYGQDREYRDKLINIDTSYLFINPKFGLQYSFTPVSKAYLSFAVANREPTRNDMVDAPEGNMPAHETLYNLEGGMKITQNKFSGEIVFYYMDYHNQLVPTGELDGVGNPIRENVGESYRSGIELSGLYRPISNLEFSGNLTFSKNKTDYRIHDEEDNTYEILKDVDISFSPSLIAGSYIKYSVVENLEIMLLFKHVGKQYLDNTQDNGKMLKAYSLFDFETNYNMRIKNINKLNLNAGIYNLLNNKYSSNGYIYYGYAYYYPQAGRHCMFGISIIF